MCSYVGVSSIEDGRLEGVEVVLKYRSSAPCGLLLALEEGWVVDCVRRPARERKAGVFWVA
jgi:hypothetical protein